MLPKKKSTKSSKAAAKSTATTATTAKVKATTAKGSAKAPEELAYVLRRKPGDEVVPERPKRSTRAGLKASLDGE
jgi:hypothetical protein